MAELPVNVIIIAILVVLVLVIVAAFFTGSFSQIVQKIKGATSGITMDEAVLKCQTLCNNYQNTQSDRAKRAFCTAKYNVDLNANGKIDPDEKDLDCDEIGVSCGIDCEGLR